MRAMVLRAPGAPLVLEERPEPRPGPGEAVVAVSACGVCRTDLHVADGELKNPALPLVLGHEVVGRVVEAGPGVALAPGARVGIPWLARTCGGCRFCASGRENLCGAALFTGYTRDGGYAERAIAAAEVLVPLPEGDDAADAPLLCAGLIGWRALRAAGDAERLGLYGFGAAAHLVAQIAAAEGRRVHAFTRPGDEEAMRLALSLGAVWAGGSDQAPPEPLDAAILFAPVGALVPRALAAVERGGTVVCAGIHMSDIPAFPYELLWGERTLRSVANLTRKDGADLFAFVAKHPLQSVVTLFALEEANEALTRLRSGGITGAAVLSIGGR